MSFTQDVKNEISAFLPKEEHCLRAELSAFLTEQGGDLMDRTLLSRECCKRAYLRGVFLSVGTLVDPSKNYDLEFAFQKKESVPVAAKLLEDFGIRGKTVERNGRYVLYIKDGEMIADFLRLIQANKTLLAFENARVVKDVRNSINRRVNCETANMGKAAVAGISMIREIEKIERTIGLEALPKPLRETAALRKEYPDASLKELGEMLNPPVGKSGINHRLRRIREIAEEGKR